MKLKEKVAVITGGNSGIGLAIAKEFKAQGAKVVIFGRNQETLDKAKSDIGDSVLAVQGDVRNIGDIERLYELTEEKFGKVDILVANAGMGRLVPVETTDEKLFDEISDINFKGLYFTVQKSIPHLNEGASIVLVSSVANQKGFPNFSVYSATKAAVRSLARSFSGELLGRGIRVNVLSPGPIETPIYSKLGLSEAEVEELGKTFQDMNPMKRFGTPEEMAKAVLFLASSDSSYVVGAELIADGGFTQI